MIEPARRVRQTCAVVQRLPDDARSTSSRRRHVMKNSWERPYPAPAELPLERPLTDVPGGETRQAQPRGAQPVVLAFEQMPDFTSAAIMVRKSALTSVKSQAYLS